MEQKAYVYAPGYIAFATDTEDGQYILSFHKGDGVPSHETRTFNTIKELHGAMQEFAPIEDWQEIDDDA